MQLPVTQKEAAWLKAKVGPAWLEDRAYMYARPSSQPCQALLLMYCAVSLGSSKHRR